MMLLGESLELLMTECSINNELGVIWKEAAAA